MGFWAVVRTAINSTGGTPDMVPLDKLFLKQKQYILKVTLKNFRALLNSTWLLMISKRQLKVAVMFVL